ncbi:DUF6146 family protein [Allomuricauda sp. d1]|uniref:DUF6146 family protein n=1 Tax=Allomuricauda sp. d1 TaxID=3136725 RepID=UPI0031DA8553
MKKYTFISSVLLFAISLALASCTGAKSTGQTSQEKEELVEVTPEEKKFFEMEEDEAVKISDDETEYEIIIIDPGFYTWLQSIARPEGYYSKTFLETRNQILVTNWNIRATLPLQFDANLYLFPIDYSPNIDYGYEVNYKLYNYFIFFQRKYNQRLGPWLPRI